METPRIKRKCYKSKIFFKIKIKNVDEEQTGYGQERIKELEDMSVESSKTEM